MNQSELKKIDTKIHECNVCGGLVDKFPNATTVSIGKSNDIVIIGESPANNGWRKSGVAWYDTNNKLLPSGIIMDRLLNIINLSLEDVCFLEAIKCYPISRKNLFECSKNCREYLIDQLRIISPKIIFTLGDQATRMLIDCKYKNFREVVGKDFDLEDMQIIPIYHPSPISPMSYKGNVPIFERLKDSKEIRLVHKL